MLYSIIGYDDIFMNDNNRKFTLPASSNPYDYIRMGYFLDVPNINGGHRCVNFNCDFSGAFSSDLYNTADK